MTDVGQTSAQYFIDQFKMYCHIIEVPFTQRVFVDSEDSNIIYHCSTLPGNYANTDQDIWRIAKKKKLSNGEFEITWALDSDGTYGKMKCVADDRENLTYA